MLLHDGVTIDGGWIGKRILWTFFLFGLEAIGTVATPGLSCHPRVIVKTIVQRQLECRLAGETQVLGEILPQRHFCPIGHLQIVTTYK
jgi:hypothetical protein